MRRGCAVPRDAKRRDAIALAVPKAAEWLARADVGRRARAGRCLHSSLKCIDAVDSWGTKRIQARKGLLRPSASSQKAA
jgi:hypothetical protein